MRANFFWTPSVLSAALANGIGDLVATVLWLGLKSLSGKIYKVLISLKPFLLWNLEFCGRLDYFYTSQQSRSNSRSNDCCLHHHNNHCHHFHSHSMLGRYHNITICQAISPEWKLWTQNEKHVQNEIKVGSCSDCPSSVHHMHQYEWVGRVIAALRCDSIKY